MTILEHVRAGLADPWALEIRLPETVITRAEARAIERGLTCSACSTSLAQAGKAAVAPHQLVRLGVKVLP